MPREIKCPKCGARTPITSLFCVDCGEKIEFSKIKPEDLQESGGRIRHFVSGAVRLLLSVAIFGGAGLILWPTPPIGRVGGEVEARECRMKVVRLHDAAQNGIQIPVILAEDELNAYLDGLVRQNRESQQGRTPANLDAVRVSIADQDVGVHVQIRLKVLRLTYLLRGSPRAGAEGFSFGTQRARLGHLPMPGPLQGWVERRVGGILGGLDAERTILQKTERLDFKGQKVRVMTRQG